MNLYDLKDYIISQLSNIPFYIYLCLLTLKTPADAGAKAYG